MKTFNSLHFCGSFILQAPAWSCCPSNRKISASFANWILGGTCSSGQKNIRNVVNNIRITFWNTFWFPAAEKVTFLNPTEILEIRLVPRLEVPYLGRMRYADVCGRSTHGSWGSEALRPWGPEALTSVGSSNLRRRMPGMEQIGRFEKISSECCNNGRMWESIPSMRGWLDHALFRQCPYRVSNWFKLAV